MELEQAEFDREDAVLYQGGTVLCIMTDVEEIQPAVEGSYAAVEGNVFLRIIIPSEKMNWSLMNVIVEYYMLHPSTPPIPPNAKKYLLTRRVTKNNHPGLE